MSWFSNSSNNSKDKSNDNNNNNDHKTKTSKKFDGAVNEKIRQLKEKKEKEEKEEFDKNRKDTENKIVDNILKVPELFPVINNGIGSTIYLFREYQRSYYHYYDTMPYGLTTALLYIQYSYGSHSNFKEFCSTIKHVNFLLSVRNEKCDWRSILNRVKHDNVYKEYKNDTCHNESKQSIVPMTAKEITEKVLNMLKDHFLLSNIDLLRDVKDGKIMQLDKETLLVNIAYAMYRMAETSTTYEKVDEITELYKLLVFENRDFNFDKLQYDLTEQYYSYSGNNKCDNSCCNCKQ